MAANYRSIPHQRDTFYHRHFSGITLWNQVQFVFDEAVSQFMQALLAHPTAERCKYQYLR
jgi:hypothetical protein